MNRQRLDSPLVYVGAHNVYYVKLPVKVLYFTIHIHTQINQYVVISDFPPVSVEKFNLCSVKKEEAISDIRQLSNISFKTGIRYESTTNYCIIHGIHFGKYCICC